MSPPDDRWLLTPRRVLLGVVVVAISTAAAYGVDRYLAARATDGDPAPAADSMPPPPAPTAAAAPSGGPSPCGVQAAVRAAVGGDDPNDMLWGMCAGIELHGRPCWPRAQAAARQESLAAEAAHERAAHSDPTLAAAGVPHSTRGPMWHALGVATYSVEHAYAYHGCPSGDPTEGPTRSRCYPLDDIIAAHDDAGRLAADAAARLRQQADNLMTLRPLDIDDLGIQEAEWSRSAAAVRNEAVRFEEVAYRHSSTAATLGPYAC